ncbi:MAG: DMT family transporter [Chloroflexi bacterium]|nr:MAG: DMT family transporter [Chloroflexota bacterium]MBL1196414.1 DMT family transporter [Chloroflexota bacterium]NOH13709.1 DMT family transporter [Chloroflexota bacterium]
MLTFLMILLAFLNGFLIVTTRVVNAKLGLHLSGTGASFWNHFIGFLFLALMMPLFSGGATIDIVEIPFYLFLGGIIGAGYVAINNLVIPKVGATKTTVLVIAGQIVLGTIIDIANERISNISMTILGMSLVVLGMWVGINKKEGDSKSYEPQIDSTEVSD